MLILIGASASGKTEIAKTLIKKYQFKKMITYTSRPKRVNEQDGVDYHFLSKPLFETKTKIDFFLETSYYGEHYYGTAFKDASLDKVLIVDIKGANAIYETMKDDVMIVFVKTPELIRKERMINRGDKVDDIKKRLEIDATYFVPEHLTHIDMIIENEYHDLELLSDLIYKTYLKIMIP